MNEQLFKLCTGDCPSCKRMGFEHHYVPVEPCEHGMIDPHLFPIIRYEGGANRREMVWCPGAGIGGSDVSK